MPVFSLAADSPDAHPLSLMPGSVMYEVDGARPPEVCPRCKSPIASPSMSVAELRATPRGFEVQGTGEFGCFCPTCGQFVEGIKESFDLECVGLKCPNCGGEKVARGLTFVTRDGSSYVFEGAVVCEDCGHEGPWSKLISAISKLKRVKIAVGPTSGVELEVEVA